jgi:hypothetical protein
MKCSMLHICQQIAQSFHYYLLHKSGHLLCIIGYDHVRFLYFEIQLQIKIINFTKYGRIFLKFKVTKCNDTMVVIMCASSKIRLYKISHMFIFKLIKVFKNVHIFLVQHVQVRLLSALVNVTKKVGGPNW